MSTKISVRLSDNVLQAVDEAAGREGRNRSQQIEWLLKAGMKGVMPSDTGIIPQRGQIRQPATSATAKTGVVADMVNRANREMWEGTSVPKSEVKADLEIKQPPSAYRDSPDGSKCKHGFWRCDKGCWK